MATTTTFWAIAERMVQLIEALTPEVLAADRFRHTPDHEPIRSFGAKGGNKLRLFEIERIGDAVDTGTVMDAPAREVTELLQITIAYPVNQGLGGPRGIRAIREIIRNDARLIRDAVFSPGNYLPGQSLARPVIRATERGNPDVWFQPLDVTLIYTEAQSLTF